MSADSVLVTRAGGVATVTLNRPDRRNAIDRSMRDGLSAAFASLDADPDVRVVVLTGAGSAFCAGVDLAETPPPGAVSPGVADATGAAAERPVAEPLWELRKPAIAAINGPAVGGGLELALACDIRIASSSARLGLTEVRIGSLPGSGGTQLLPRIVGPGNAARMLLTGDLVESSEALRMGLVSEVVPDAELADAVAAMARRVADNAPLSLVAAKRALRAASELGFAAGQALERSLWAELAGTEDRAEGRAAFRERRPARFVGR